MRRIRRPTVNSPIRRVCVALALVALGFGLGRALPPAPPTPPLPISYAPPASKLVVPASAPSTASEPTELWQGGVLGASSCDVSRAAERALAARNPLADPLRFRVQVLRVVDGDTIRVLWHGRDTAVRLLRIDTPETGQPGFREAADCLRRLIDGSFIEIEFEDRRIEYDRYGRLLAYLWKDGRNLNVKMLQSGHVVFYDRYGSGKYASAIQSIRPDGAAVIDNNPFP